MGEEIIYVDSDADQVGLFMQFAEKYKNDFASPEMQKFADADAEQVFKWIIENYREEEGEIIVRPKIYYDLVMRTGQGLDCDDATIFWCALLRFVGVPPEKILIAEVAEENAPGEYVHIFCGVCFNGSIVWLDNLPGSVFGKHKYDERLMHVALMSDYL